MIERVLTLPIIFCLLFMPSEASCAASSQQQHYRQTVVSQELDAFEGDGDYGRQRQYQNSLEVLQSFVEDTQKADVVYDDSLSTYSYYNEESDHKEDLKTYSSENVTMPDLDYKYRYEQYKESSKLIQTNLGVYSGYRQDDMDWSIAGNLQGANPNILTEYEFDEVKTLQIKAKANLIIADKFVIDGYAAYGEIDNGQNAVTEYDGNNRTDLAIRTENDTDESRVTDLSGAIGWRFKIHEQDQIKDVFQLNNLYVTALLGYSRHEQFFDITNGNVVIDNTMTQDLGPFSGLHSSYNAQWKGPWLGLEIEGRKEKLTGLFRVEYHVTDYDGWGQLNLRSDFQQPKSFVHTSEANGWVMNLGLGYQVTDYFSLDFLGDLQLWNAKEGVDRLFLTSGGLEERQLNGVDWQSYALMLGGTLRFK